MPWAAAVSVLCYAGTVVALALTLKVIPMSITYVVWTGAGTAGVALFGVVLFGDMMTPAAWIGLGLVIIGGIIVNMAKPEKRS